MHRQVGDIASLEKEKEKGLVQIMTPVSAHLDLIELTGPLLPLIDLGSQVKLWIPEKP